MEGREVRRRSIGTFHLPAETKAELLRIAYAGGLVNHNSPEKWRKEEIASAVVNNELPVRTGQLPPRPRRPLR
jgi:hypothetical protein